MNFLKKQSPVRIISLGFALVILIGSVLLSLPCSIRDGVTLRYIDALYMSTSAVCVTGLLTVDAGDTFTPLGQFFLGMLIQVGGLGVTAVGTGVILAMGKKINLKARNLIREAGNLDSGKGVIRFIRLVFLTTVTFELAGAALSFLVFRKSFPPLKAAGVSLFHSVASFNNSGFDILGGGQNLIPYQDDILLNLVTCALVIFGGIGFLVIREVIAKRFRWKKLSMHAKVVLSFSVILWLGGALGLGLMEWNNSATLGGLSVPGKVMASLFQSVSTRTAGMNTVDLASCGTLSKLLMSVLQFIGAAPGSTGGGVKVTTFAVIILTIRSVAQGRDDCVIADHHIESKTVYRALTIIVLGAAAVIGSAIVVYYNTSDAVSVVDAIFESCSAFGTVGLSVGVTSQLNNGAKILYMLVMFMGRVGPVAFAMSLTAKPDDNKRKIMPVGHINVG